MAQYEMNIDLNVLNHLGINLYTKIPAVLSEAVANSYDADAKKVDIMISEDCVIITDDGSGMDNEQVNKRFLTVGYQKRNDEKETPIFHRKPMGRKGIGKLSLFSIANNIEVHTFNGETKEAFIIDVSELKSFISNPENSRQHKNYEPTPIEPCIEKQGTIIRLTNIRKNRTLNNLEKIRTELARRFNVFSENFQVTINGEPLSLSDRKYFEYVSKIYTYGDCGFAISDTCKHLIYGEEKRNNEIGDNYSVSGWIGFVDTQERLKTSDDEENANKIFLFCRGKMGQEDILSSIRNSSNYNQYIVGVINADFFDEDSSNEKEGEDMATTSRENFNQESEQYKALKEFLLEEIKYIGNDWNQIKENEGIKKAVEVEPVIAEWFEKLGKDEQRVARKVFGNINKCLAIESERKEMTKYGILAFEKMRYAHNLSAIENVSGDSLVDIGKILGGIDAIEESLYYQIVNGRLDVLKKFQDVVSKDKNALEKFIQNYLFKHLWLLDPSWERPTSNNEMEITIKKLFNENVKLTEDEKSARLDICFKNFAGKTVVIELKRYNRHVSLGELVDQVGKYSSAIEKCLSMQNDNAKNYEIIIVLGQIVEGDSDRIQKTLAQSQARIVYYDQLIRDAQNAYKSYFEKHDELNDIIEIFKRLDS